ncbi:MAG: nucleotidyltransferase [Lachnospiraceae bacterium]|nr:nucleotidyltransferase [Lachnospiraceae bacterium]
MNEMTLVILAAGMGSRYGGLKQMDPIDGEGHKIIDFSIYDAMKAGFTRVVFIIKREMENDFRELVGDPISKHMKVEYVFQDLNNVPEDFTIPEGRVKPWGTTHALCCCKDVIDGPFMVINADDYYGRDAYNVMYSFLNETADEATAYSMVAYELGKTLTEKGSVTRGVCNKNEDNYLTHIVEQKNLVRTADGAAYTDEETGETVSIDIMTPVSMNMWGFKPSVISSFEEALSLFFREKVAPNPMKAECLIPTEMDTLIHSGQATVKVLNSHDRWFGVTYQEDKPFVMAGIKALKDEGLYPKYLWK